MNLRPLAAALGLLGFAAVLRADAPAAGVAPLVWSQRLADSSLARLGTPLKPRWDYTTGLFALSLLKLADATGNTTYRDDAAQIVAAEVAPDGTIAGYKQKDYTLDSIAPGKVLLALNEQAPADRYRVALQTLRDQLRQQPRTASGGFWHKQIYPNQMWLDGLFMAGPFYAQYAADFHEPADFDDIAKQILLADAHTYDPATGLFYHGWDESRTQPWADPQTGHSPSFWGRAIGWYAMAIVDTLDFLPADHAARPQILAVLSRLAAGLARWQDPASGLWWQVVDQGARPGNYLEGSASSMFVYALAKAVNHGYLPRDPYAAVAQRGYAGIIAKLLTTSPDGRVNLTQICQTAGLGGSRDGTFEYYIHEKIVANDFKGIGPFILAGIEMNQLEGLASNMPAAADATASASATSPAAPTATPATSAAPSEVSWADEPAILARIVAPVFPARDFPITDYGAVAGGQIDCTDAIRQAIVACHAAGGGRVVVPAGTYLTGAIHLLSNVNLHLADHATLKFTADPAHYLPAVPTRWEGTECVNYSALIYALDQENIAVTGNGTLDGSADANHWWNWTKGPANPDRKKLVADGENDVPVAQRVFGAGHYLRPNFIQPYRCKNVLLEGFTVVNSPMWEINPELCTNVIVRGVTINCPDGPNNDGCDPESSRDVLIENCTFSTGDDCISIKSGRNRDGRRVNVPSENLIIRGCTMKDGHGGVVIGSEVSGHCRNVFVENCHMDSPQLRCVLRFKDNAQRGGVIENVFLRNVEVGRVADAVLLIDFAYEEGAKGPYKPVLRNVSLEHVTGTDIPRVVKVSTFPGAVIENVRFADCSFQGLKSAEPLADGDGITYRNVTIESNKKPHHDDDSSP
jgi:unsaturated rhamnogalacturonyl hydrolase